MSRQPKTERKMHQTARIPPRDLMRLVYDMHESGVGAPTIARRLKLPKGTVGGWLGHPDRFDPYLDEIALERALKGERPVFMALTMYEVDEFYDRVEARLRVEPYDNRIHHSEFDTDGRRGTRSPYWLHELEDGLGVSRGMLRQALRNRARARAAAA